MRCGVSEAGVYAAARALEEARARLRAAESVGAWGVARVARNEAEEAAGRLEAVLRRAGTIR